MTKLKEKSNIISKYRTAEVSSGLVRIAHKISSTSNRSQAVKIGDKYFRVRELG